jgi:hypothetical protein
LTSLVRFGGVATREGLRWMWVVYRWMWVVYRWMWVVYRWMWVVSARRYWVRGVGRGDEFGDHSRRGRCYTFRAGGISEAASPSGPRDQIRCPSGLGGVSSMPLKLRQPGLENQPHYLPSSRPHQSSLATQIIQNQSQTPTS